MKRFYALCIVAALAVTGCGSSDTKNAPKLLDPIGVDEDTVEVKKMELSDVNNIDGQIVPEIVDVCFDSSGNIGKMKVSIGDKVKKGQLLATLSGDTGKKKIKKMRKALTDLKKQNEETNKMTSLDIDMAKAELLKLQNQRKSTKRREEKKQLDNQIVDKKESIKILQLKLKQQKELQQLEVNQKQADISEIVTNGDSSELRAPIDGEVISTAGGSGYMIQGGRPAVRIANMSKPRIMTDYVGTATLNKASSYSVLVKGQSYPVTVEEQEVDAISIETGQNLPSSTYFDFKDSSNGVSIGDYALIQIHTESSGESLVLPANAVNKDDGGRYVYKKEGDRKVRTTVTIGTTTDAYIQIVTGLEEGDVVYVAG